MADRFNAGAKRTFGLLSTILQGIDIAGSGRPSKKDESRISVWEEVRRYAVYGEE